jgi:hypothetical protein
MPTTADARRAGVLYLLFALLAIASEFFLPRVLVPGDPAATLRNIAAAETLYRLGVLASFVTLIFHLLVVTSLYRLLRAVDGWHALLMVLLVGVGVALAMANLLHRLVPLVLLRDAAALTGVSRAQLEATAFAALRWQGASSAVVIMFWGLWLFPFGALVYKSAFLPRWLGVLLCVAGVAYLLSGATTIAAPAIRQALAPVLTVMFFGEVPIIFWLLRFKDRAST